MELLQEEWKPLPGWGNRYYVSNLGRIRNNSGILIKAQLKVRNGRGHPSAEYLFVELSKEGKRHRKAVHRLVADTFIPKIAGKTLINHKDANKWNNRVDNLEWVTHKENAAHSVFMGLNKLCLNDPPITKEQIPILKRRYSEAVEALCKEFGISKSILVRVISGREYKKHIIYVG